MTDFVPRADLDVVIVGAGPRGLSVLERLVARLTDTPREGEVRVHLFDPDEAGPGRVWRTSQSVCFLMNTAAGEVSVFSGEPDGGPVRAGAGPSFADWLADHPRWSGVGPDDYGPRAVYGEYLRMAFESIVANAPAGVTVRHVPERAASLTRQFGLTTVTGSGGTTVTADKVVLTTGHPRVRPDDGEKELLTFARHRAGLTYLRGDSAADMPLGVIAPGEQVGVIGLGLTFFDVLAELTIGRGGRFVDRGGRTEYLPSGREPHLVAGSRSGLVMLARGRNQKAPTYRYSPKFVTGDAIVRARRGAQRVTGSAQLDFVRDVLSLLRLEVEHVYYTAHVRRRHGEEAARWFADGHLVSTDREELLAAWDLGDVPPLDLEQIARPFVDREFDSPDAFHDELLELLRQDVAEAREGNVDNPLKAALDILRDTRGMVRQAVDFAGLRPESHREFVTWFNPINTMVSAGPPWIRVDQAAAVIRAGLLTVVGPGTSVRADHESGTFVLESSCVAGSRRQVSTLIDARIPRATLSSNSDALIAGLVSDGLITELVNTDLSSGVRFRAGSVSVTRSPFHVIDVLGNPDPDLYALGVPTENTRWFTQIGTGRPGPMTGFHTDADGIAEDVLRHRAAIRKPTPAVAHPAAAI
ncbi:FAD/NAD(P)-binding protein [Lentzea sp. NEAU-D7]|uniref:FAD/NAD(P)-binding protein n=1 Tax=Lentzea sp. NEAU-D7 TaxID=2994667 RepID=UPI00224B470C|nr:FAD/NAD(P)-binding protein [Lentzea sp. NEAU-D7]MCX2954004.1 FAD/NAD(P)-binding protein [Lentzea sp. NEAU-D7]